MVQVIEEIVVQIIEKGTKWFLDDKVKSLKQMLWAFLLKEPNEVKYHALDMNKLNYLLKSFV